MGSRACCANPVASLEVLPVNEGSTFEGCSGKKVPIPDSGADLFSTFRRVAKGAQKRYPLFEPLCLLESCRRNQIAKSADGSPSKDS